MKEDILKTTFPRLNEPHEMLKALEIAMIANIVLIGGSVLLKWDIFSIIMSANMIALIINYAKKRRAYTSTGGKL